MKSTKGLYLGVAAIAIALVLGGPSTRSNAQQTTAAGISIGDSDLGGVVSGPNGPEAGVWVIAETTELPTKFAKIVVTDDQGRYVLPDLPKANYSVWVRGYGLVDSPKVTTAPGKMLNLTAVAAPNAAAAAEYYPAIYWWSMLKIPDASEFPGTGPQGNGIPTTMKSQSAWLAGIKTDGCVSCHQLGNKATRTIPESLGKFNSSYSAWVRRVQSGQASETMVRNLGRLDTQRAFKLFADWTDRIAAGELPKSKPQRPQGIERNIVVTVWDWGTPTMYLHDEISTDRRKPTINANGPIFGSPEWSTDFVPVLDPVSNRAYDIKVPVRDPEDADVEDRSDVRALRPTGAASRSGTARPDRTIRCSMTRRAPGSPRASIGPQTAAFCRKGSDHPSAQAYPGRTGRAAALDVRSRRRRSSR